jgi:hypothetical protein
MNIDTAAKIVAAVLKNNLKMKAEGSSPATLLNPQLIGDPGIGKTESYSMAAQLVSESVKGFECRSVIVAQYDAGEMGGMPYLGEDETGNPVYKRARPDWLPSEGTGVLVLDELTQAPGACLNIVAQLANEHRIGEHELGAGWVLGFANNKLSNRANTFQIPTHLADRLMPLDVEAEAEAVIKCFNSRGYPSEMTSFLKNMPQLVADFDPSKTSCPSPRSWARAVTILEMEGVDLREKRFMLESTVGVEAANHYMTHLSLYEDMIDPDLPINTPETAPLPEKAAMGFILCAALAARMNDSNCDNILNYCDRMPNQEHTAFLVKSALQRTGGKNSNLIKNKALRKWLEVEGRDLLK